MRKHGYQRGLDTPVVHAVNYEDSLLEDSGKKSGNRTGNRDLLGVKANALNPPPEEYGRKVKTQRNRRGLTQVVEHVV